MVAPFAHHEINLQLRVCLHGGGGPQVGEVTCSGLPHQSCKRDQIKRRDCIDKRVTSPTWGSPPPNKRLISCMSKKGFGHTHIQLL